MAYAMLQEYHVEVYYDGKGVCYFRGGWSKFFANYGVQEG
jgi:hypothetical protein